MRTARLVVFVRPRPPLPHAWVVHIVQRGRKTRHLARLGHIAILVSHLFVVILFVVVGLFASLITRDVGIRLQ